MLRRESSNQSMKPTAPCRNKFSVSATTTLPWLISVSLDDCAARQFFKFCRS